MGKILHTVKWLGGYVPFFHGTVFKTENEIVSILRNEGLVKRIRRMDSKEVNTLFMTLGPMIRNRFMLWHPMNPYTMEIMRSGAITHKEDSMHHPDNFSWSVLRSLIVAANAKYAFSEAEFLHCLSREEPNKFDLDTITTYIRSLVMDGKFVKINDIFVIAVDKGLPNNKMQALVDGISGYETFITPMAFLNVAIRAKND